MSTIKIAIAGKAHELSIEDAKKLHEELSELFPKSVVIVRENPPVHHHYHSEPIFAPHPSPFWAIPQVTC